MSSIRSWWTGPFDDIVIDDLGLTETAMSPQDWRQALESLRPVEEIWQEERATEEQEAEGGDPTESWPEELAEQAC